MDKHELSEAELQLARDFAGVWNEPRGRRVLEHILNYLCGVDAPLTAGPEKAEDPYKTFYAVGRRDVGVDIKRIINRGFLPPEKPRVRTKKDE